MKLTRTRRRGGAAGFDRLLRRSLLAPALLALLALVAPSARRAEGSDAAPEPHRLRIAYLTFSSPNDFKSTDSTYPAISEYLQDLSNRSRDGNEGFSRPVDFDVVVGNYYQVYEWLRTAQIDAAVVSPFIAELLGSQVVAVAAFAEHNELRLGGWEEQGQLPVIRACARRDAIAEPIEEYEKFVEEMWAMAERIPPGKAVPPSPSCRIDLVSHLSSSGFVAPVLYTAAVLSEIDRGPNASDVERTFWKIYFGNVCFDFSHGTRDCDQSERAPSFHFSYSGSKKLLPQGRDGEPSNGGWAAYGVRAAWTKGSPGATGLATVANASFTDGQSLVIPNDVLVVRDEVSERIVEGERQARWCPPVESRIFRGTTGYRACRPYEGASYAAFAEAVKAFKTHPILKEYFTRWYEIGDYDFTVDDVLAFLAQDQGNQNDDRLTLVLPGGGVKGAYQSKMLDLLYGCDRLRNRGDQREIRTPRADDDRCDLLPEGERPTTKFSKVKPLIVDTVVGTSGGALVGAFIAQIPKDLSTGKFVSLAGLWNDVSHRQVFYDYDSLRWVSLLVLLILFRLFLYVARGFQSFPRLDPAASLFDRGSTPLFIAVLFAAALVLHPVLRRTFDLYAHPETTEVWQGLARALILLAMHFSLTCVRGTAHGNLATSQKFAISVLALACLLAPLISALRTVGLSEEAILDSFLLGSPVALVLVCSAMNIGFWRIDGRDVSLYLRALALLVVFLALTAATMGAAVSGGLATTLELTPEYWLALLASATLAASVIILVGWRSRIRWWHDGLAFLTAKHRISFLLVTPVATLVGVAIVGVGWWLWVGASGLYGNQRANAYLRQQLKGYATQNLDGRSAKKITLRTRLVVTGSVMERAKIGPQSEDAAEAPEAESIPQGDLYFCFAPDGDCAVPLAGRLYEVDDLGLNAVSQPIFASGSPFPVFPAHQVRVPIERNGHRDGGDSSDDGSGADRAAGDRWYFDGKVIDGGYGHNVPIHAAQTSGARQVLIIRSAPIVRAIREEPESGLSIAGQLAANSGKLFGFMFDLSQAVDDRSTRSLVVASISPHPEDGAFPPLTDFRRETVERMLSSALADWNRRVGRIESWGPPNFSRAQSIRGKPIRAALGALGWTEANRALLESRLQRTAVFDFDNTCIRNDLGEAVFLRLIMQLAYDGGSDEFWSLIREPSRDELKRYWEAHRGDAARFDLANPSRWSSEFKDYLVLFLKEYDDRWIGDDARPAYEWVVQLFTGMREDAVEALTAAAWKEQLRSPWKDELGFEVGTLTVESEKHGQAALNLGIRRYAEILELIDRLQIDLGWNVWIATASSVYSVRAVAPFLHVPRSQVLGMELEEKGGRLTSRIATSTYRQGKWDAIAARGLRPALVVGDSMTDFEMLQRSGGIALVIDRGKIARELTGDVPDGPTWVFQPVDQLRFAEESAS